MKNHLAILGLALLLALPANAATNYLDGKIIALDSGHGGPGEGLGAVNLKYGVAEADVNWNVREALKAKLNSQVGANGSVVMVARLSTRKERMNDAVAQCVALDLNHDGTADGRKCDVLVSIHHNGSSDPTHDGTLVIYNEKQDIPLATALHDSLIAGLGLNNEGYLSGGYGMTVYGHLVSALTEAYYITNDCEAELYLYQTTLTPSCNKTIYPDGDRVDREANLHVSGLTNYFASRASGGKGVNKKVEPSYFGK